MKTRYPAFLRLFAAGLLGAVLAAPVSAAVAVNTGLKNVAAPTTGVLALPPPPPPVRVHSPAELLLNLYNDKFTGRLIIPADARWDLSDFAYIPLRSGVSLIGERGPLGSRPLLYTEAKVSPYDPTRGYSFFELTGNDVLVQGIHFQGAANGNRSSSQPYTHAITVIEDAERKLGRRVTIADNEFDEWTGSGVQVVGTHEVDSPEEYDPSWPRILPEEAGLVRVERNYMHHNARDDGGYGVVLGGGAYVTIEGNVFDYNRHAVSASGRAHSGYVARFNYVLQGGFRQDGTVGSYYNQHFDVHGRGDGGYGGPAGEKFEIAFNTVRGEQEYYVIKTRPAFMLRGTPAIGASFHDNVLVHESDEAVSFKGADLLDLVRTGKFQAGGNLFDTDYSTEVATGDFDGDGLTDVFVATGTAWFYSRGGVRPWEFLHASTKRTHELGFADIDNDGITDVLYRDGNGNLGYLKSGTVALVNFTTTPVLIKDLRFGDFDGDGKTDIFYTLGGKWYIWYGSTRTWTFANLASSPITELLFGEFDDVRGTDVVGIANDVWSYSSGGRGMWARLNAKLTSSFANAVVADFNGNGKSDIAFGDGDTWRYSRDGRFPLVTFRGNDGELDFPPLKSLLIGQFGGDAGAEVVAFERQLSFSGNVPGERLAIWRGLGSGNAFSVLSQQNMR